MNNILVPIDFSEPSSYALKVAATIAKQNNAKITVLHMLGLSEAVLDKDEIQEYEEAKYYMNIAKKRFKTFLEQPYLKQINMYKIVQNYKKFSELNNVAREQNSDLIVMGSHGTSGFNELFLGSNTEKVVRTSDIPVLVIKSPIPNFKIKKILFACSFNEDAAFAFKNAMAFAEKFSAKLKLVYINTPHDFSSTDQIQERISKFMFKAMESKQMVEIYNDYSVELGLLNYSKQEKVDVLAIATHGRQGLSRFFMGSIGEGLANHAPLPVLTFKL